MRARGLRANVPSACQLPIFTCQRAKGVPIIQLGIHRGIGVPIFQFHLLKGLPIFQTFFKRTFQLLHFSIMLKFANFKNIWAFLENLFWKQRIQILTFAKFH